VAGSWGLGMWQLLLVTSRDRLKKDPVVVGDKGAPRAAIFFSII
jgi:hypothetical protein